MKAKHEFYPIRLPIGTVLPVLVHIYFSIGKYPIVVSSEVNSDGSTTPNPLIVPTFDRDADNYVRLITLKPAPGESGTTDKEIEVNIYPQNIE